MFNWYCRNFYYSIFGMYRRLGDYPAICDICNKKLSFADYPYMCRKHGDMYYKSRWKFVPKFIFRMFFEDATEDKGGSVK